MAYRCVCGNAEEFLVAFDVAVDVVDGNGDFRSVDERNVAFYMCPECKREIGYREFVSRATETQPRPA
jgi:hypothetical protein